MRYYFDMRDSDGLVIDEEGVELPTLAAAQEEAARSLAEMGHRISEPKRAGDGSRSQGQRRARATGEVLL